MMTIDEISSYFNKRVVLTLTNGKEKMGRIAQIDADSEVVTLKDESGASSKWSIKLVGGIELLGENVQQAIVQEPPVVPMKTAEDKDVQQQLIKLETNFDAKIQSAEPHIIAPNFELPADVKRYIYGPSSLINQLWTKIKTQNGNLNKQQPEPGKLQLIIGYCQELLQQESLAYSAELNAILGFFCCLSGNFTEAVKAYKIAVREGKKSRHWFNLAVAALKAEEREIACIALDKLFGEESILNTAYEQVWYPYLSLCLHFNNFEIFRLLSNRFLLAGEPEKLFDAFVYIFVKLGQSPTAQDLIQKKNASESDLRQLLKAAAAKLPVRAEDKYILSENNFKAFLNSSVVGVKAPPKTPMQPSFPTYTPTFPPKAKYSKTLQRARAERDVTKNFEEAARLFKKGLEEEHTQLIREGAVRDWASMLAQQMNQPEKAIEIIETYQKFKSDSDLNLLYNCNYLGAALCTQNCKDSCLFVKTSIRD